MIQVIKYKCCGNIFAACTEPDCYTDQDWTSSLRKYVLRGDKIEMIKRGKGNLKFKKCECPEKKPIGFELFPKKNKHGKMMGK